MTSEAADPRHDGTTKEHVRNVYNQIAGEYDRRIPGTTRVDERFMDTETAFVLERVLPEDRVLDLGCGTGRFTLPVARRAADVVGLDLSAGMLDVADAKAREQGLAIGFEQGDMADLPFESGSFDVVVSMLALMHVPLADREQVFAEIGRVLRPGGRAVIGVKNEVFERFSAVDRFAAVDITDVAAKELLFTETDSGRELRAPWASFSPADLRRLFALSGLTVTSLRGNIPFSCWLADGVVADPHVLAAISGLEAKLGDIAPFNELGYHLLAEAVKPRV